MDLADQTLVLTRHVAAALPTRLSAERDPAQRVQLANQLLGLIASSESNVEDPLKQLRGIHQPSAPGATSRYAQRPKTPLNDAALLTNAPDEPSLAAELKAEIESADSIDLLCAFVMWRGLRLLETPLQRAREADIPIRVLTTTYIGGTEREALDRLVRDFGAEVPHPVRRCPHATAREGMVVPPRYRVRHGIRGFFQPVDQRAA